MDKEIINCLIALVGEGRNIKVLSPKAPFNVALSNAEKILSKLSDDDEEKVITMFDRPTVKKVHEQVAQFSKTLAEDYNLRFIRSSSRFADYSVTFKIEFNTKSLLTDTPVSQTELSFGHAPVGSIVWCKDTDGHWYRATILQKRRTKYLFEWTDHLEEGRKLGSFRLFQTTEPKS